MSIPRILAGAVESHVVADAEIVALTGAGHVIVTIQADLWPGGRCGARRARQSRPLRGLGFLAAERATHAAHLTVTA